MRSQCTRSKEQPRNLTIKVQEEYQALAAARVRQTTEVVKQQYAIRAGIEGTIHRVFAHLTYGNVATVA